MSTVCINRRYAKEAGDGKLKIKENEMTDTWSDVKIGGPLTKQQLSVIKEYYEDVEESYAEGFIEFDTPSNHWKLGCEDEWVKAGIEFDRIDCPYVDSDDPKTMLSFRKGMKKPVENILDGDGNICAPGDKYENVLFKLRDLCEEVEAENLTFKGTASKIQEILDSAWRPPLPLKKINPKVFKRKKPKEKQGSKNA